MYLSNALVELSFSRLSSGKKTGKTSLEKTSALMYFLAFDAAVKKTGKCPLDLNPDKTEGRNNRADMELEFVRLVMLKGARDGKIKQVMTLGRINDGGSPPEKRISSNFFTVPLKKASQSAKAYQYPSRPAPVLKMGDVATGLAWGIGYFDEWREHLPKLLSEVKSNTPFTDLAVFACRNDEFKGRDIRAELAQAIASRFSQNLTLFWTKLMDAERVFFRHGNAPFQSVLPSAFLEGNAAKMSARNGPDVLNGFDKATLVNRIVYLESLLDAREIEYEPIT